MPVYPFGNLKQFSKFGIVRKPRPSEILQWKIIWKKGELTFYIKYLKIANFDCKNFQPLLRL